MEIVRSISRRSLLLVPLDEVHASDYYVDATAVSGDAIRRFWFESKPFSSQQEINRLATIRFSTYCRHQGWADFPEFGSYSWFEIAILTNSDVDPSTETVKNTENNTHTEEIASTDDEGSEEDEGIETGNLKGIEVVVEGEEGVEEEGVEGEEVEDANDAASRERIKKRHDGSMLSWIIYRIPVDQNGSQRFGVRIDANHELLTNINVGDSIGIFACAQFPAWRCMGWDGALTLEGFGGSS